MLEYVLAALLYNLISYLGFISTVSIIILSFIQRFIVITCDLTVHVLKVI